LVLGEIKIKFRKQKLKILFVFILTSLVFSNLLNFGIATDARYAGNFDDITAESAYTVYLNSGDDKENLAVYYNLDEGPLIITGVSYLYVNYGPGTVPCDVQMRLEGDNFWVEYFDSGIPYVGTYPSWRTFRFLGPTYLIDDNPWVRFFGTDLSDNCIALCCDSPSIGNSWYDIGSGWSVDPNYEYIVELIYEWIITMDIGDTKDGFITSTDLVDAYFITLSAGITYEFELRNIYGSENLNMRLVTYQELTNNVLTQSEGISNPEYMRYTPSSSTTYVLLVETNANVTDTVHYSFSYNIDKYISDAETIKEIDFNRNLVIISILLACLSVGLTGISLYMLRKKSSQQLIPPQYTDDNVKDISVRISQKFCVYCGDLLNENDKFCRKCGKERVI